jgi:hypothetical protein
MLERTAKHHHRAQLLAVWFLAACTPRTSPTEPTAVEPAELELLGMMQTHEGLALQLRSGGCRDQSDVDFAVVDNQLVITRLDADECDAMIVLGEQVLFAWAELPTFGAIGFRPGVMRVLRPGSAPGPTTGPAGSSDEGIYGVLVTEDGLDVRVFSAGCTGPDHFTAWIEPGETEIIHLVRTKLDGCEAEIPEGMLLHFTWAQLRVTQQQARLANPIDRLPPR